MSIKEDWAKRRKWIEEMFKGPSHRPVFGGLGKTLCGELNYNYSCKPTCEVCKKEEAAIKAAKGKKNV